MDVSDFTDARSGRLLRAVTGGYWTFVPDPLPPKLDWTRELVLLLSAADQGLGRLAGAGAGLENPYLLIRPFARREAVLSSRIEGTQASLSDLFLFEAARTAEPPVPDVREVANYVDALEYGIERGRELPVSLRLIRELHGRLMHGVRGQERTPGEFRRSQNWIGPPGCSLTSATYVPPPVPEMTDALGELEKFLHARADLPLLVRLAMAHYQFEAIHPFLDGNGRIGRLLISLLPCLEGALAQPLLYLSAYFERNRELYYRHLLDVSRHGAWSAWVKFFLTAVAEETADAVGRADRLRRLRADYHSQLHTQRGSSLPLRLVDELFKSPAVTITGVASLLKVTSRTAFLSIDRLTKLGILVEATGRPRNRVFVATGIVRALEEPTPA